jgi:CubicO group peptidase (beta-lactamase class C family)
MQPYILGILILILVSSTFAQSKMNQDGLNDFRGFFSSEIERRGVVGASYIFSKNGEVVLEINQGLANLEKSQPVDKETIFHWASNTKTLTGIAIMQLRDRGMLELDDRVTKYLPELSKVRNPYGSMDDVTIRHLMTHSSGFRNPTFPYKRGLPWEPFEPTEYSQLEAMLPFTELLFKPGERFGYSNPGILFLGRIIEKLTGDDYEVYIEKNLFKPLGMNLSYFDTTPHHMIANRSHSYFIENGNRREGRFDANTGITVSNGGLNAPLKDMVKYFNFLVGVHPEGGKVLARGTLEEMFVPTVATEFDANGYRGLTSSVGLAFFIDNDEGDSYIGHGGDQNGFMSYTEFNLQKKTFSIIVMNTKVVVSDKNGNERDVVMNLRHATRKLHKLF